VLTRGVAGNPLREPLDSFPSTLGSIGFPTDQTRSGTIVLPQFSYRCQNQRICRIRILSRGFIDWRFFLRRRGVRRFPARRFNRMGFLYRFLCHQSAFQSAR
jgi:hypothetical protein